MDLGLQRRLAAGPAQFPYMLDPARDRLLLAEVDPAALRTASFLDQRLLGADPRGAWVPLEDALAAAPANLRDDAHYVFHIGHVGSTLLSRLVGELPGVFALREPLVLRTLAEAAQTLGRPEEPWSAAMLDQRLGLLRRLLARTPARDLRAVIKATSFVSEIADRLVPPDGRAIFLTVRPESYLRTIFAGENSRVELAMLTPGRLRRFSLRLADMEWRHWSLDEAERAALGWATEVASLQAAADALPDGAVLWLDFDDLLACPAEMLACAARHFGFETDPGRIEAAIAGPIMRRYSKAPEHEYSPELRRRLLADAGRTHAPAIQRGMAWLERAGAAHPAIGRALDRGELTQRCSG